MKASRQNCICSKNPEKITVHDPIRPDGFYGVSKAGWRSPCQNVFRSPWDRVDLSAHRVSEQGGRPEYQSTLWQHLAQPQGFWSSWSGRVLRPISSLESIMASPTMPNASGIFPTRRQNSVIILRTMQVKGRIIKHKGHKVHKGKNSFLCLKVEENHECIRCNPNEARRTQFQDKPLTKEIVTTILNAGRRAQSSKNEQTWHFIAIQDKKILQALSECGEVGRDTLQARALPLRS